MILAAGRGERMRPLTDRLPKPLLEVGGAPLIVHQLRRLAAAGLREVVINHSWLGEQIEHALGDGGRLGVRIRYSPEPGGALETAGGIVQALELLSDPFIAVNADVWTDYPWERLPRSGDRDAHLVLVDNPPHHTAGDFALVGDRVLPTARGAPRLTFSGIGRYRKRLFQELSPGRRALGPVLSAAAAAGRVSGEHYAGQWIDVGTPQRLAALDALLDARGGSAAG